MSSYRITTNEIDRSQTLIPNINNVGAMAVRSGRGPVDPVFISAGQEQRIIDLFGAPDANYPDIIEAIEFNKVAPLWIVSATNAVSDTFSGLLVQADMATTTFTGVTAGDLAAYTFSGPDEYFLLYTKFPVASDYLRADVVYNEAKEAFEIELQILRDGVYETYEEHTVSLTEGATGDFGVNIYIEDVFEDHDFLGVVVNPTSVMEGVDYPVTDEVVATGDGTTTDFTVTLANTNLVPETISVTLESTVVATEDLNGFGDLTGTYSAGTVDGTINYVTGEITLIFEVAPTNLEDITIDYTYTDGNGFYPDVDYVGFSGGSKSADLDEHIVAAWNKFQSKNKYPAKIFMDTSALDTIPAVFDTLRTTYQQYASYILALPFADTRTQAIETKSNYSINNRGLAFYWNHGLVRYGREKFYSPLTGRVGRKYAAMVNVFNGLAPSWKDENGHGGQLGPGVIEMRYDPTEDDLKALDEAGINPISFDPNLGVMIMSQKTAVSPGFISDDSYIGHSRLFDTIIENIVNQVLTPQITKLNDEVHRRRAVIIGDTFMRPMVDPSLGLLNAYKIKCDLGNNDATARSQRKFVYSLAVQVTPFSEFIEFNFVKAGQSVSVESVLQ